MTRAQLEHILRASAAITGADRFIVLGSQAILGQYPDAPRELLTSMEADIASQRSADDADLIDGSIGEESPFHTTFGYFGHGVSLEVATLPHGWESRLVRISTPATGGAVGLCVEAHDLAVSKLVAGREKDIDFIAALLRHGLVKNETIMERLAATDLTEETRASCIARLGRIAAKH